jgi:hypothetical protein
VYPVVLVVDIRPPVVGTHKLADLSSLSSILPLLMVSGGCPTIILIATSPQCGLRTACSRRWCEVTDRHRPLVPMTSLTVNMCVNRVCQVYSCANICDKQLF